jgi:hypothetical protein
MFADQKEQAWVTAMEKIDNSKFEVIKLNINPYAYIVDSGFENENDDYVVNTKTYHVFKSRIRNNVMELYCLKTVQNDVVRKNLKKIVDNQFFENSPSKENPIKKLLKSFLKDYIPNESICFNFNLKTVFNNPILSNLHRSILHSGYFNINYLPPDFV